MNKNRAEIVVEENVISIEPTQKKNRWRIKTKVFNTDHPLAKEMVAQTFYWQTQGAHLTVDRKTAEVFLVDEIEIVLGRYLNFRHDLAGFTTLAREWRESIHSIV